MTLRNRAIISYYAIVVLAVGSIPVLSRLTGDPIATFTRDVFSTARIPVYTGWISNLGVSMWIASAAITLFAAWIIWGPASRRSAAWLAAAGALSSIMAVDDFLMVHEWLAWKIMGISETPVLVVYVLFFAGFGVAFRRELLENRPPLLFATLLLLGSSLVMDVIEPKEAEAWRYLAEEGLKMMGIASWLLYFVLASEGVLRARGRAA
jgi:hypothetical protein